MSKHHSLITLRINQGNQNFNIGFSPSGLTHIFLTMYSVNVFNNQNAPPFPYFLDIKNQPTIPNRSEHVANGIPLLNTNGEPFHVPDCGLPVNKNQMWSNSDILNVEIRDYNGLTVTVPFEIEVVFLAYEKMENIEWMHGPGPVTLLEHPKMRSNFHVLNRG